MPLTIRAMTAVHTDRLGQKLVANLAASTAALRFFVFGTGDFFHVFNVGDEVTSL